MNNRIYSLIKMELNHLKNICPLVYTKSGGCMDYKDFFIVNDYSIKDINNFIINNNTKSPVKVSNIYFVNGYRNRISLKEHIGSKYNVRKWE